MEGLYNSQEVTGEGAILSHLTELADSHSPVRISPSQANSSWMIDSLIQEIKPQNGSLYLHKPEAKSWSHLNSYKEALEVSCCTPSGVIRFHSNYMPSSVPRLESSLRFQLPSKLIKSQRRAHVRVKVGHLDSNISLRINKQVALTGVCLDLSVAGALLCLPRGQRGVDLGEVIERCTISITDIVTIRQPVKVCSIGTKHSNLLVGVQFLKMSDQGGDVLGKTLNHIECQFSNT